MRVAVVDSGVNVPHPHLPASAVSGGSAIGLSGEVTHEYVDRLGHGTAAAAAIHEKAPEADLWIVKVFDEALATTVPALVRAMDLAIEEGCRIVNLSLGTPRDFRRVELEPAVARAVAHGVLVVSAFEHLGQHWYPGSIPGAVGVVMRAEQPRDSVSVIEVEGKAVVAASPYPRPIPSVPPERNLNGISFAVANATGVLARLLSDRPDVRSAQDAMGILGAEAARVRGGPEGGARPGP